MSARKTFLSTLYLIAILTLAQTAISQPYSMGCLREETLPSWVKPSPPIELLDQYDDFCDLSPNFPPISSQGGQGSCTAWATGYYYKSYLEWEEHGWDLTDLDHRYSPAFIYNQINGGGDNGSYVSDAFKLLTSLGCASWSLMPYTDQNCTTLPDEEDYYFALPFRSQAVYTISLYNSLTDIKNHLLNGHAAVFAISVYANFNNIGNYNDTYCLGEVYGDILGGHAVTFCGFDDSKVTSDGIGAFKVANSWGTGWGTSGGYFWMSYEAVQSSILCWGTAYYCTDRIGYQPTIISRFQVDHDDRYAMTYEFGVGDYNSPLWSQDFFNWYMFPQTAWSYPASNIVVDLSDGAAFLNPGSQNELFMSCHDRRAWNGLDGSISDFTAMELTWPGSASSQDPPVPIPDNGGDAIAALEITQAQGTPVSGDATGTWTQANSPYFVTDDVTVPQGQSLTIEPGVEVTFLDYNKLTVSENATLLSVGTEQNSILFSPFVSAVGWHGIRFEGASNQSQLEYCHLEYGKATGTGNDAHGGAIFCSDSDPTIANCLIERCSAAKGGAIFCLDSDPAITENTIIENSAGENGGGIYCQGSNPTISDNFISENSADDGGGIHCFQSSPAIAENVISGNTASVCGGGIGCSSSSPEILDNTIENNSATHGGGIGCLSSNLTVEGSLLEGNYGSQGGGIFFDDCDILVSDNTFDGNTAVSGGAINGYQSSAEIVGNTITGNSSGNGGGITCWFCDADIVSNVINGNAANGYGGGIYCLGSDPELINNVLGANSANFGGGMSLTDSDPVIKNCTISRNEAQASGGGIFCVYGSRAVLMNSIIYYNTSGQIYKDNSASCLAAYCNIQGGWDGVGNINANPMFMALSDYHLADWSPSIGSGIASVEIAGTMYQAPSSDLDGNPRPDPAGSNPDQGAYENTLGTPAAVEREVSRERPLSHALYQNHPNPFNPTTAIRFDLPVASFVRLEVFDITGRLVGASANRRTAPLLDGWRDAGRHEVTFDGSALVSGVYIYRITAGNFTASGKMVLMK